jgi:hypothetical protein
MSTQSPFISTPTELAAYPANRAKLQAIVPANVSPWFLDALLAQRPLIPVNEACKEILLESHRLDAAANVAALVNKNRKV